MLPGSKEGHACQRSQYPTARAIRPRLFADDLGGYLTNRDLCHDSIRGSESLNIRDMLTTMWAAGDDSLLNSADLGD